MCKKELLQSSGTKNELFKVQEQKTKLMSSLGTKTIFWLFFFLPFHIYMLIIDN